jgi:anaerobic magnesium-protoporphyrin IX monomethyl ester cyclase
MSTLLLFPPVADPAHPPLGIASLAGYLTERGRQVAVADLNVRGYNELLTARYLECCARLLRRSLDVFESKPSLAPEYRSRYRETAENLLSADYLIARVDEARGQMRDRKTYATRQSYARAAGILRRAMQFVSAAHYPAQWTPGGFSMSHECTSTLGVLDAIRDRRQNFFLPFFEQVMAQVLAPGYRVVGISLNYYGQLIPAITLASVVRKLSPQAFVVVGGGLICFFEGRWDVLGAFENYVDGWVPFEGEQPLFALVEAIDRGGDLSELKGLVLFENGKPLYRPAGDPLPPAEFPVPDYDGLRLAEYLIPEPVLPVLSSRGCYWGRCAFCSHARLYRDQFRRLSANDTMRVVLRLHEKYSASCFYFVDEAIPPATAAGFAQAVISSRLPLCWFGETRMERSYTHERLRQLHDGGCLMLIFGLESAVLRVLDAMDKGITPENASRIFHDCAAVGIRAFVMFFTGFPSETRTEAEQTVDFVEQHADCITHVATSRFVVEGRAPVFRHQDRYGVSTAPRNGEGDLKTWCTYHVKEGMQAAEVSEFVKEIEQRNSIRPPGSFLISRSHLVFLPPGQSPMQQSIGPARIDLSCPERLAPRRSGTLLPYKFAFNLDEVQRALESPASVVEQNATCYVFDQDQERLIEVGNDGTALLGVCSGRYNLAEILDAVGSKGRETTLSFLEDLSSRNFIKWEALP